MIQYYLNNALKPNQWKDICNEEILMSEKDLFNGYTRLPTYNGNKMQPPTLHPIPFHMILFIRPFIFYYEITNRIFNNASTIKKQNSKNYLRKIIYLLNAVKIWDQTLIQCVIGIYNIYLY